jgi:hypothetical protein
MTDTPKLSDAVDPLRGKDQADGLRKIFGDGGSIPTYVIVSSLPPDASVTAGIGVAHLMLREGKRLLFIDEVPLGDRFDQRHFNKVRYDISQALTGTVPLEKVASKVSDRFWFSAGAKLQGLLRKRLTRQPITVPQCVQKSSLEVDLVLAVTQKIDRDVMRLFGGEPRCMLLTSTVPESLKRTLINVRELSVTYTGVPIPIMVVGGESEQQAHQAYELLERKSLEHLQQPLAMMGWVRTADLNAMLEGIAEPDIDETTSFPVGAYRTMSTALTGSE